MPAAEIDHDGDGYVTCCGWVDVCPDDNKADRSKIIGGCDPDDTNSHIIPGSGAREYPIPTIIAVNTFASGTAFWIYNGYVALPSQTGEYPGYNVQVVGTDLFMPGSLILKSPGGNAVLPFTNPYPGGSGAYTVETPWAPMSGMFAGNTLTATFVYPDGSVSAPFIVEPYFDPGTITSASVAHGKSSQQIDVAFHGANLFAQRFVQNIVSLAVADIQGRYLYTISVPVVAADANGESVTVAVPSPAVSAGAQLSFTMTLVLGKPSDNSTETLQFSLAVPPELGEHVARNGPEMNRSTNFVRSEYVGTTIAVERAKAGEPGVTMAFITHTPLAMGCFTFVTPAGESFGSTSTHSVLTGPPAPGTSSTYPWDESVWGSDDVFRQHRAVLSGLPHGEYYHYSVICWDPESGQHFVAANDAYFRVPPPTSETGAQAVFFADHIKSSDPADCETVPSKCVTIPHTKGRKKCTFGAQPGPVWLAGVDRQWPVVKMILNARSQGLMDFGIQAGDLADSDLVDSVDLTCPNAPSGVDCSYTESYGPYAGGTYLSYESRYHHMHEPLLAGTPILGVAGNHDTVNGMPDATSIGNLNFDSSLSHHYFDTVDGPGDGSGGCNIDAPHREWFSADWGQVHVVGLSFVANEDASLHDTSRNESIGLDWFTNNPPTACGWNCDPWPFCTYSEDGWTPQLPFFLSDMKNIGSQTRWRVVVQHASPIEYDGQGSSGQAMCGAGDFAEYCQHMNEYNVDFVFDGHSNQGLRRHLQPGGGPEDFVFSYRQSPSGGNTGSGPHGVMHLRFSDDAIVLSRLWYPPPPYVQTDNDIGAIYECYKYMPGAKSSSQCRSAAAKCTDEYVELKARPFPGCGAPIICSASHDLTSMQYSALTGAADTWQIVVPCCQDTNGDGVCARDDFKNPASPPVPPGGDTLTFQSTEVLINGVLTKKDLDICNVKVQVCDRKSIPEGCLRRQVIPIVTNYVDMTTNLPNQFLHTTSNSAALIDECTPCALSESDGSSPVPPDTDLTQDPIRSVTPACGRKVSCPYFEGGPCQ